MEYNQSICGKVIRNQRKKRKISQEVFSGFAVMARSHVSEVENGKRNLQLDTFWKIAQALDMKPSELLALVEEEIQKEK
ncbi:MAG: helix-turn-helix domain-containing protein [Oscillospiraceae bacterium]|nr:helix-turn-helix domain-containing protein [Oscillospiraceae bacterium]